MNKKIFILVGFLFMFVVSTGYVSAHVTVKPAEVNVGVWQNFSIGVPVEKDIATVGVKLVIPAGLESITPNVKPGWKITTKKDGENVTEISWTNGVIPPGQRDEFVFSAHVPSAETQLQWKAYQTYQDGSVVSWDQTPTNHEDNDDHSKGPYSITQVVDDFKTIKAGEMSQGKSPQTLPIVAIVLSATALTLQLFRKK